MSTPETQTHRVQTGVLASLSHRRAAILAALFASLGVIVLGAAPALATSLKFGSEGEGAGQFRDPTTIAVDQASGDVYIGDALNNRVDKFGPAGEFLLAFGWGVANGAAEAQTCGPEATPSSTTCLVGLEGAGAGEFNEFSIDGIAIDDSLGLSGGDIYVEDARNERVEKFKLNGEFVLMFGGEVNATTHGDVCLAGEKCQAGVELEEGKPVAGAFERLSPRAVTVSPTGSVYVGDIERAQKFSEGGVYESTTPLAGDYSIEGLAIDAEEHIYVDGEPEAGIRKYDAAGTELGQPRDPATQGYYTSISLGSSGELFVADPYESEGNVLEYTPSGTLVSNFALEGGGNAVGFAFSGHTKTLYALYESSVQTTGLPTPGPQLRAGSESATDVLPTDATLNVRVDAEGQETTVHFEYGESESYGSSTPAEVLTGGAFEDQTMSATVSQLKPSTTYYYRAVASSECEPEAHPGHECVTDGQDETFTTLPPVSIEAESASQVSSTSANLEAELNGHSRYTEYRFEYGLTTGYGSSIPIPDGSAGSSSGVVSVSALIEALTPDTVYHYRLVAHNAAGVSEGTDKTFVTQAVATNVTLPDGRAWEMVSPPDKHGVRLEAFGIGLGSEGGLVESSEDGNELTYIAKAPIENDPPGNRSLSYQQYLATRGADGWSSQDITTPNELVAGVDSLAEYRYFSSDLSLAIVEPEGATPLSSETSEWSPYVRQPNGEYLPLVTGCPPVGQSCPQSVAEHANVPPGTKFGPTGPNGESQSVTGGVKFIEATADFGRVLLGSTSSLVKGFETDGLPAIYELHGGKLEPVSVLPNGESAAIEGGGEPGFIASGVTPSVRHALSANGERVFFETIPSGSARRLYMRDIAVGKTLALDTPETGAKGGEGEADFQAANADGSKVFFTDTVRLTTNATSGPGSPDLYMCEIGESGGQPTCTLKDLTVDAHSGESANVQGTLVSESEDGTYVYFVARGVLASGASPEGSNLYVTDTVTGETKLVAVLSPEDAQEWEGGTFHSQLELVTAKVSTSGRYLAFMSQNSLTGYDNRDAVSGVPDQEVYEYDALTGRLVCASCNPTGARPVGMLDRNETETNAKGELEVFTSALVDNPAVWRGHWLAGSILGYISAGSEILYQPRYLDDNGRLFFNSTAGLVPQDANGKEDVYEFEPEGIGSCNSSTSTGVQLDIKELAGSPVDGCIGLISSGTSSEESAFLDASGKGPGGEEGEDVFFMTEAKLSPADLDNAMDIYEAHTCSASAPCPTTGSGVPPACTTAESCRAASPPQPAIFGASASQTFNGAGNATSPGSKTTVVKKTIKCAKGKKLSRGKCIKEKAKKKRKKKSKTAEKHKQSSRNGGAR